MIKKLLLPTLLGSLFATPLVQANPTLLAIGTLTGSSDGANTDLSGLTYQLENGLPANLLGGLGSGLAYAGGNTFIAIPDRGPNARTYDPLVDNTTSYIDRFHTISMELIAVPDHGRPYSLTPNLSGTTLLSSPSALNYGDGSLGTGTVGGIAYTLGSGIPALNTTNKTYYFTGRSDGFGPGPSSNPSDARFDPESVRVSRDGRSVFISDEYGPYIYQFDRATGQRIRSFTLPNNLAVEHLGTTTASEGKPFNTTGRVANKGMEGLAITPDGRTLVGIMQAPLLQDRNGYLRLVTIDIASGITHEYAYKLTTGTGVSDIVAINDHEFLVDERDGKGMGDGTRAVVKQLFRIDIAHATDVSGIAVLQDSTFSGNLPTAVAVAKSASPVVDLVAILSAAGIASEEIPAKIEGLAFGPDILDASRGLMHTLFIANDNDFVPSSEYADPGAPVSGQNTFFVVGLTDQDLPDYQGQQIPLPSNAWLIGIGLLSLAGFVQKRW